MDPNKVLVKVVMLGQQFGGKTSLVKRFLSGFFDPANYSSTVAAEYKAKRIEVQIYFIVHCNRNK